MPRHPGSRPFAVLLLASPLALACGGGGGSGPPPGNMTMTVAKTSMASGDAQSGTVGQPLGSPLRVVVTEVGSPAEAVTVNWSTGAAGGAVTPPQGETDANGVASSIWTLGTAAGAQTAQASVAGASGSPVTFTATARADAAASLEKAGGDGQTGELNSQLSQPVQARVGDRFGNPVGGTNVEWSATGATPSLSVVPSDAAGLSQVTVTLGGVEGSITIVAEADGLAGSPLTFTATAVAPTPPPGSIAIAVGNDFFRSDRNGSTNPAVDTLALGGTATWTWNPNAVLHNVTSNGVPSFTSSTTRSAPAQHGFTFTAAGTYRYYCSIHASAVTQVGMVGRIVVR